ncbi:MAG: hypothetical protein ACI93R_000033 [Flavobacteriales bacterium]|jgi:uncharacterized protein involved in response to NO
MLHPITHSLFRHTLFSYAFRPFFLLAAIYALLPIVFWVLVFSNTLPFPAGINIISWHFHELIFGFVSAAITGFVLTAVCNWTGAKPLCGVKLAALAMLWIAGRVAIFILLIKPTSGIAFILLAAIDLSYIPILAIILARILIQHQNQRNLKLVLILAGLFTANTMIYIGLFENNAAWLTKGKVLAFDIVTAMSCLVAGRITPVFSKNWLRAQGRKVESVKEFAALNYIALGSLALLIPANLFITNTILLMSLTFIAAISNAIRLGFWATWSIKGEPLLWSLHLAYAGFVVTLLLKAFTLMDFGLSPSIWQHTLGLAGIVSLIFAVMTRVSLGHTGRPLKLMRFGVFIYLCIIATVILRLAATLEWLDFQLALQLAATTWSAACVLFLVLYSPILLTPRPDERPG